MAAFPSDDGDPAIRIAARREAGREGLALGSWLDRVMTEHAAALGVGLADLDGSQRIEAIKLRLGQRAEFDATMPPVKPRARVETDSPGELVGRNRPIRDDSGRNGMTSVALLRQSFKDFTMPEDTAARTKPTDHTALRPHSAGPRAGGPRPGGAGRAAQRQEIETKLSALFKALERTPRRADHGAAAEPQAEGAIEGETRLDALLGETAISPAWRLDKAVGEIAERQAFLERQAMTEGMAPVGPRPAVAARLGGPLAAAADLRRRFEQPNAPETGSVGPVEVPAAEPVPSVFSSLQGDMARLAKRLDAVGGDVDRRPPASARRQASVEDLRALLDERRPDASIDALGRQVASITAKLDQITGPPLQAEAIDRLSRRIEEVYAEILARLSAPHAAPAIDMEAMERLVGDLVLRAEQPAPAPADLSALERAVHDLAGKLEHAERSREEPDDLVALKAQVGTLAERLDKSDAGLTAIVAIERSLADLFAQIGQMQTAALQAKQTAAATVAQATARDVVQPTIADVQLARVNLAATDAAVGRVSRDLAEFRATRDEADRELQSILSAMNASLERVVDRLAALESDAAEGGSAPEVGSARARIEPVASRPLGRRSGEPLDLDRPIEPSLRLPATASAPDPTMFIAAARRAAATAEQSLRISEATESRGHVDTAPASSKWFKSVRSSKRRPLLLALASLTILAGVVQAVRVGLTGGETSFTQPAVGEATPSAAGRPLDAVAGGDAGVPQGLNSPPVAAPPAVANTPEPPLAAADQPGANAAAAQPAAAKMETAAAPEPSGAAQASLPTMAMGPKANMAAMQAADLAGRAAAAGGIPAGLRAEAEAGAAAAQYEVGLRYAEGRGVTRDLPMAASWFDKAARQGLAPAAYRLGSVYEKGLGLPRDAAQSVFWYGKAAEAGNVRAMHNLAVMLAEGVTGKPDYAAASGWFTKAAEAGVKDSQYNLAILYARGMGVEQNLRRAYTWFAIAAAQGDADAAKKRDDVEARLDPDGLAQAKTAAAAFKPIVPVDAANEVLPPAGGWDASSPAPRPLGKERLGKG